MTSVTETLLTEVESVYQARTPGSAKLYEQAVTVMPGGESRNSGFWRPYPLFIERGEGAYVVDVDGNRYLDCTTNYTSLVLGHAHPAVVEAVTTQASRGTAYAAANRFAPQLARLLVERVQSIDELRFTNSGTEATMLAVRAARAFTGRPAIVKMQGGYHGSHDDFAVTDGVAGLGTMPGTGEHTFEVPFNDKAAITHLLDQRGDQIAAVIVEGIMGSAGMLPPLDGYLTHLRDETARCGILLIVDEVMTLRLAVGGAQDLYQVRPDLTTMGKIIGGGFPVGAFGGRAEIMELFSPLREPYLPHAGTFNANPITMAAGLATLGELDADTIGYINRLGERLTAAVTAAGAAAGVAIHATGAGSLRNLHFAREAPRDAAATRAVDGDLRRLFHLKLLTDGVMLAPRGLIALATVTTEREIDGVAERIDAALRWMRPAVEERAPELVG